MRTRTVRRPRGLGGALLGVAGIAALSYAGYVSATWARYGRRSRRWTSDPLLDRFIPDFEVAERHELRVTAPVEMTYSAARNLDLSRSLVVRAIFAGRSVLMGATASTDDGPAPLLEKVLALGWGILAEVPGRKIILGAVTQPWHADVVFQRVEPDEFASFNPPGYAKIVWTLEAEAVDAETSIARTETRVATTDPESRERFRRYWAAVSPGILLIRRQMLRTLRKDAERLAKPRRRVIGHLAPRRAYLTSAPAMTLMDGNGGLRHASL